jgi:heterodisulfide reductase subunit B
MGHEKMRNPAALALYPGCSLESSSKQFRASLERVLEALELPCPELRDWTCCGASSAHAIDPELGLDLALRNLAQAEQLGYSEILAPCAACYHRLASADLRFRREAEVQAHCNGRTGLDYQGGVRVRNLLDLLTNVVSVERIRARVRTPLSGLRVACYYGCLNTRTRGLDLFDDRECPTSMDLIVEALGATAVDWGSRTECCGGSLFLTAEGVSARLVAAIVADAAARDAQCIAVSCPMCQNNLDVKQPEYRSRFDIPRAMPVLFVTQLMGLAFGETGARLGLSHHVVPFMPGEMVASHGG